MERSNAEARAYSRIWSKLQTHRHSQFQHSGQRILIKEYRIGKLGPRGQNHNPLNLGILTHQDQQVFTTCLR